MTWHAPPLHTRRYKKCYNFNISVFMVPTDHDILFSRTFQGLLRYIFKDFSRTFLCSFKHPFAKNDQQWTFQIRHTETILSWVCQKNGGVGDLGMCFFTFADDLLYYGYNTAWNNSAWKGGGSGSSPRKFLLDLVQNTAILYNPGGYTSLVIMSQ